MIDIAVTTSGYSSDETSAFTISFQYNDPQKTMDVTNALAANFTSENLKIREEQALGTSTFLADELKATEGRLKEKEEELKQYKESYMGGLPEQLDTNQSLLERLQMNLDQLNANLRDAENRRLELLKEVAESNAAQPAQSSQAEQVNRQADDLASLKTELASLESRYTRNHPDVVRLKQTISAMEKERAESQAQSDATAVEEVPIADVSTVDQALKRQIQEINVDIANYKANINETNSQIKWYQAKVADTPKREQELLSLNRDYENLKASYSSLLDRKLEADLSVSMEKKQKGEQFKVIDYAKLPSMPVKPDVRKIALMTLALGLVLGCGLAYLMEMMDTSYKTPDDAEKELQLPVLASFPFILTETEQKHIKRKNILVYTGVAAGFILSVIGILVAVRGVPGAIDFLK
jgi:polysaccharide chain length determinant protein (PEP-CTERM system associated)